MDSVNAYFGAKMDSGAFLKYIKGKDAKNSNYSAPLWA